MRLGLGLFLQILGLSLTLGSIVFFGFRPTMEEMLFYAGLGAGTFYLGRAVQGKER